MKKLIKYVLLFAFGLILFMTKETNASTGSTVFIGEPIVLDSYENVEMTLNDVEINEETSEIKNTHLFTNLSDKIITKKASIKLEDSYSKLTINSLKILVNGLEIKEIAKEGDTYSFSFQILPNEGKKIEITYKTDNDLQNAKIIKYTMDSIKGKEVKLYKINVKFSKYDIPLVQKIWPGAYEFENNIVSTEYFDFKVNNLTSNFIIQKETYKDLKYGDYVETYKEIDKYILDHAKEFIDNGVKISSEDGGRYFVLTDFGQKSIYYFSNSACESIFEYVIALQLEKDGKQYTTYHSKYDFDKKLEGKRIAVQDYSGEYCLVEQTVRRVGKDADYIGPYGGDYVRPIYGKMVAINYYETENNKELYVEKSIDEYRSETVKRTEYTILRTVYKGKYWDSTNRGYQKVFVNSDINGNSINVSEEEIIQFVNMMNIDLYLRIVVFDPSDNEVVKAGYYNENSKEIVSNYVNEKQSKETKKFLEDAVKKTENEEQKKEYQEILRTFGVPYKKFDNKIVADNSKVPTLAHCVGYTKYKDGKLMVNFIAHGHKDGLGDIYEATECETAKKILTSNKLNNDEKRNSILTKINNTKVTLDSEEYKDTIENTNIEKDSKNENNDNSIMKLVDNKMIYIVITLIALLFFILLIFIIKKGEKNNGKK